MVENSLIWLEGKKMIPTLDLIWETYPAMNKQFQGRENGTLRCWRHGKAENAEKLCYTVKEGREILCCPDFPKINLNFSKLCDIVSNCPRASKTAETWQESRKWQVVHKQLTAFFLVTGVDWVAWCTQSNEKG